MKKLLYLAVAISILSFAASCEKEAKNPGDFSLKSALEVEKTITSTGGEAIDLTVSRSIDSTYRYFVQRYDTLKDAAGDPVLDASGRLQVTIDTVYYNSSITAKYVEMEPITLKSVADTFTITLKANTRWSAPQPSAGGKVAWFYNYNKMTGGTLTAGGGDGDLSFRTTRNRGYKRAVAAVQYIMSRDSTVLYKLVFNQAGEKDI